MWKFVASHRLVPMNTRRKRVAWLWLCLLGVAPTLLAEKHVPFNSTKLSLIDGAINQAVASNRCPAPSFGCNARMKSTIRLLGAERLCPGKRNDGGTIFDAASLTKVVATTPCLLLLVERGQLRLEDRVRDRIPDSRAKGPRRSRSAIS